MKWWLIASSALLFACGVDNSTANNSNKPDSPSASGSVTASPTSVPSSPVSSTTTSTVTPSVSTLPTTLPTTQPTTPPTSVPSDIANTYQTHCAACHQSESLLFRRLGNSGRVFNDLSALAQYIESDMPPQDSSQCATQCATDMSSYLQNYLITNVPQQSGYADFTNANNAQLYRKASLLLQGTLPTLSNSQLAANADQTSLGFRIEATKKGLK